MGTQGASPLVLKSFLSLLPKARPKKIRAELVEDSPVTHISPGDPPFMLLHSDNDEIVYPQQSQEFAWDLAANKVPFQFVMVQGGGHEFDQAGESPDKSQIIVQVIEFFVEVLAFHQVPQG
jgi:dipeptidyl aminopeptidase/acylaminoacyl peptidase